MQADLALQAVETAAVIVGVAFGLIQLRQLRVQREIQAGIELLRPLHSPMMPENVMALHALPEGLSAKQIADRLGERLGSVLAVLGLFESLGPVVARGHIPIDMYADSYRGVTVLCWKKMRPWIEERRRHGWPNLYEWLEWLAERMEDRAELAPALPAAQQFAAWKSPADYDRLRARA